MPRKKQDRFYAEFPIEREENATALLRLGRKSAGCWKESEFNAKLCSSSVDKKSRGNNCTMLFYKFLPWTNLCDEKLEVQAFTSAPDWNLVARLAVVSSMERMKLQTFRQ
jgi:hypothetical protein